MHRLLPLVQEAVALLCSLGQVLMLSQLRCLKVNKTEVGTPPGQLQAHLRRQASKWVGAHLCVCKNYPPGPQTSMSSDIATTSQSSHSVVFIGLQNLCWERSLDFFSPTSCSNQG